MTLPRIFSGQAEPLSLYSLITLNRIGYSYQSRYATIFARIYGYNPSFQRYTTSTVAGTPYVMVVNAGDHWIVQVNGTTMPSQAVAMLENNVHVTAVPPANTVNVLTPFLTWATDIRAWLLSILVDSTKPIVFTGHSLGGALAHLLQYMYRQATGGMAQKTVSISFGSPRFATSVLWNRTAPNLQPTLRVMVGFDIITTIPAGLCYSGSIFTAGISYQLGNVVHGGPWQWYCEIPGELRASSRGSGNEDTLDLARRASRTQSRFVSQAYNNAPSYVTSHLGSTYSLNLRRWIDDSSEVELRCLDCLNQAISTNLGETLITAELLQAGFERDKVYRVPEEPAVDYFSLGGTWDNQIDNINAAPAESTTPPFSGTLSLPMQQRIQDERDLRRRRRI